MKSYFLQGVGDQFSYSLVGANLLGIFYELSMLEHKTTCTTSVILEFIEVLARRSAHTTTWHMDMTIAMNNSNV